MFDGATVFVHRAFPDLAPPATFCPLFFPLLSFGLCVEGFFPFPPLILRWLDLICMYLHNESHLHARGGLYHENRHEKVCVRVCARACVCSRLNILVDRLCF